MYDEEWDGDIHIGGATPVGKDMDTGEVVFKKSKLPWQSGRYEVSQLFRSRLTALPDNESFSQIRYHHDGKYNVMSMVAPVEISGPLLGSPMQNSRTDRAYFQLQWKSRSPLTSLLSGRP